MYDDPKGILKSGNMIQSWATQSSADSDVYSKKDQVYKITVFLSASTVVVPDGQKGNTESLPSDSTPERDEQGFLVTENGGHSFLPSPPHSPPSPTPQGSQSGTGTSMQEKQ